MQDMGLFTQALVTNMLMCFRERGVASRNMSVLERKRRIMASANMAMAITRGGSQWGRAIIARHRWSNGPAAMKPCQRFGMIRSRKILKRSFMRRCRRSHGAKTAVKRKLQVLKRLVPGGYVMDDRELVDEALDYVISLRAQVYAMQCLANAAQLFKFGQRPVNFVQDKERGFGVELRAL